MMDSNDDRAATTADVNRLKAIRVLQTMIGGKVVFNHYLTHN